MESLFSVFQRSHISNTTTTKTADTMATKTITIIGSLNTDLVTTTPRVPSGGETLTASAFSTGNGGKGANQAVACARMARSRPNKKQISSITSAVQVKMIGAVGDDLFGGNLISGLQADFIDTSGVRTIPGQSSGVAVILVEEKSGENRILITPGANYDLKPEDFKTVGSLGSPKPDLIILQLEIPIDTVIGILRTAKTAGISCLLNPAPAVELPEEVFNSLDHLIMNESEAAILSGKDPASFEDPDMNWQSVSDSFLTRGVKNVVITLGSKGAYYSHEPGHGALVPAAEVKKVVDTTAAGDTFVGAYAVEFIKADHGRSAKEGGWDIESAVGWACRAAGRTVEKAGAQDAIPWMNEVIDSMLFD